VRIKLDENLPISLAAVLSALGHDADTATDEGLSGQPDPVVWRAAQDAGRFLVTQDLDFSDGRTFAPGSHHGILLLRLRAVSRRELIDRVTAIFTAEDVESWAGCFVVATEAKIRVRHPPAQNGGPADQSPP
jgi:predicted nuclease of predicted toxin-antitoxin system